MKSKWIPLVAYNDSGKDFLVLAKRNRITGMIRFRTKRMTGLNTLSHFASCININIVDQFAKVMAEPEAK